MQNFQEHYVKPKNIFELACLRAMSRKISKTKTAHAQVLLYITNSCFYTSQEEISIALKMQSKKAQKILNSLAEKKLIHKNGCLYKPKPIEEIEKIME